MATRKESVVSMGEVLTADQVAGLDYDDLVSAWAAVDARHAGPDPGLRKFAAAQVERRRLTGRLETIAADDPRVVGDVAAAVARRHPARRTPGDLAAAESRLALAAIRASSFPTAAGHVRRGPFAELTSSPGWAGDPTRHPAGPEEVRGLRCVRNSGPRSHQPKETP